MSFAVLHMKKFKKNGVKGIQFHNQRERDIKTNIDVDKSKSHLNYDLANDHAVDYNLKINELIKSKVETKRAIRKDAVVMCNFVISSDKTFFDNLSDQEQKRFFTVAYAFFENRYGDNIIAAPVHLDETTPHMHLSLVPITEDKKLSAKRLFDRKELRFLQEDFPKYLQIHGFDLQRGVDSEGKNKHIEIQRFKAMQLEKDINTLTTEKNALKNDLNALRDDLREIDKVKSDWNTIDSIQAESGGFLNKGKVLISENDFELLKSTAKSKRALDIEIEKMKDEYDLMEFGYNDLMKSNQRYRGIESAFDDLRYRFDIMMDYLDRKELLEEFKKFYECCLEYSNEDDYEY